MSELINSQTSNKTIRSDLLATVSALVLGASMVLTQPVIADEGGKPTVWIELGGQAEFVNGMSEPFEPPFVFGHANPGVYDPVSPVGVQKEPKFSFGEEGSITFEPKHSDWVFSAGIRYGRSVANRYAHQQTAGQPIPTSVRSFYGISFPYATGNLAYAE